MAEVPVPTSTQIHVKQVPTKTYREMTDRERKKCRSVISAVLADHGIVVTARKMQCTNQNVYRWQRLGWMPAERAVQFCHAFKQKLSTVRPDLWGRTH